jgi:hypothetical protein
VLDVSAGVIPATVNDTLGDQARSAAGSSSFEVTLGYLRPGRDR